MACVYAGCTDSVQWTATDRQSRLSRLVRLTAFFLSLFLLAAAGACDKGVTESGGAVADLVLTPPSGQAEVGGNLQLSAELKDAAGNPLPGRSVFWASSDSSIATVSSTGLVRGKAVGVAQIAASAEGRSALATVRIVPRGVASVRIESAGGTLGALADTMRFRAVALDADGNVLPDRQAVWSSSAGAVAVISSDGLVTAVGNGVATIRAEIGGAVSTATLSVAQRVARVTLTPASVALALGDSVRLRAEALDANSFPVAGADIRWASSNMAVARVDATGLVTGVSTGQATITAAAGGIEASASAAVALVPVGSIEVRPSAPEIRAGESITLTAVVRDERGNVLSERGVSWTSSDPAVVAVDAQGRVTGVGAGTATVTASSGGKSGGTTVTVAQPTPAPVARVEITPAALSLVVGGSFQLTAIPRDANGNVLSGRSVSWVSSNSAVVTVDASGTARGVAPGSATLTATSEGQSGTVAVTIFTPPPVPVASVDVSPPSGTVEVDATLQLTATARDAAGNALAGRALNWTSSDPAVASVSGNGLVTGAAPGQATITVSSEGQRATVQVTVVPVPVASVEISAPSQALRVGESVQFTAVLRGNRGNSLTGRPVSWSSSDPSVAIISPNGRVTGVSAGSATITATAEGRNGTASVTVSSPPPVPVASVSVTPSSGEAAVGSTLQLNATAQDASGNPLAGRPITWSSSDPAVARVNEAGLVTGVAAGTAVITATSEGRIGTADVRIRPVAINSIDVTPPSATVAVGETTQLSATARDAAGQALTGRQIGWISSDRAVATVDANGLVRGVAPGTTTITASAEGVTGTAAVTVAAQPVVSVEVQPASRALQVGEAVQLTATPRNAAGAALSDRQISWSTSNADVATVDAGGLVRGVGAGTATITATSEGRSGTAAITVSPAPPLPVASVAVTPASSEINVGSTTSLTATTRDAAGNTLTGRAITWTSSDPAVAAVSGSGVVTGLTPGTVTITATSEGASGTAQVTVQPVPVASVDVSPSTRTVQVGNTTQLTATVRDAAGNVLSGRPVAWSTSNAAVATVDATGQVLGISAGSATITATVEGRTGTSSITVTAAPPASVASVEVSPASQTVQVGQTVQLSATPRDAAGNALTGRDIEWTSSNAAVATVDGNGLVRGVAPGTATIRATSGGATGTAQISVAAPAPAAPAQLVYVSGSGQTGSNNQALPNPLVVRVLDAAGNPVPGVSVSWSSERGELNPATSVTNAQGYASTVWTLRGGPTNQNTFAWAEVRGLPRVQFTAQRR